MEPSSRTAGAGPGRPSTTRPTGECYCFDGNIVTTRFQQLGISNGLDWSVSGDELHYVDTAVGTLTAGRYNPGAEKLGAARVLRCIPAAAGLPNGLTVDSHSDIWLAVWDLSQVWRLDSRTGAITAVVHVPTRYPTSCVLGGSDLSTLYITTATDDAGPGGRFLYAVDVPARGRISHRFAGEMR